MVKYKPVGNRLLIEREVPPEKIGSIVLPKDTVEKERIAICKGKVIAMGDQCYKDFEMIDEQRTGPDGVVTTERVGRKWCNVGDTVMYQVYAGMRIPDPQEPSRFIPNLVFVLDKDVVCILEEDAANG